MTDLYRKIVSQRSGLERIIAKIPGFRGYNEMSARREADRMIRNHIVGLLREQMNQLARVDRELLQKGGLSAATKMREAKTQFQLYIDRVNAASPGYSGFYSANKIGPDDLERIYAFDAALVEYVDMFRAAIDEVDVALDKNDNIDAAIAHLETVAVEANQAFNLRENVFTEIS